MRTGLCCLCLTALQTGRRQGPISRNAVYRDAASSWKVRRKGTSFQRVVLYSALVGMNLLSLVQFAESLAAQDDRPLSVQ